MGSRGAFVDVDKRNFTFVENGQKYYSLGTLANDDNIKILIQKSGSVKAPEYSHTENRVYAIVQDGKLKHLSFYDQEHKQHISVDLLHPHKGVMPHVHVDLNHDPSLPGNPPTAEQLELIKRIKKEFNLS